MQYLFIVYIISFLHPFHVSVTDIIFKEDDESLQITHRLFIDDMEETLGDTFDISIDIIKEKGTQRLDSLLEIYIFNHFKLYVDGDKLESKYIGHEVEEEAIWVYSEVMDFDDTGKLKVTNKLMTDVFSDQSNLVHFDLNEEITSLRLSKDHHSDVIEYRQDD